MKGDSNWVAAQYENNAEILLTGSEPIKGKDILAMWGGVGRSNERDWSFTTTDLQGDDNFLVETGTYDIKDIDKKPVDRGKYLIVWRKQADGSWMPKHGSEHGAGKVYATSLAVLALTVEYHYLPIYQR